MLINYITNLTPNFHRVNTDKSKPEEISCCPVVTLQTGLSSDFQLWPCSMLFTHGKRCAQRSLFTATQLPLLCGVLCCGWNTLFSLYLLFCSRYTHDPPFLVPQHCEHVGNAEQQLRFLYSATEVLIQNPYNQAEMFAIIK